MLYEVRSLSLAEFVATLEGKARPVLLLEGSREVREEDAGVLIGVGKLLAERLPWAVFRSGNAEGSDSLFAEGVRSVDAGRMEVVTPTAGHRKGNLHAGYSVSTLGEVSEVREEELAALSSAATPSNRSLLEKRKANRNLGAKAKYLLRDTLKVVGDSELGLSPADAGLFYTKADPMSGGTGHTIRVCLQQGVPVLLFDQWKGWLSNGV